VPLEVLVEMEVPQEQGVPLVPQEQAILGQTAIPGTRAPTVLVATVVAQEMLGILAVVVTQAPPVAVALEAMEDLGVLVAGVVVKTLEAHEMGVTSAEILIILEMEVPQEIHETLLQMSQTVKRVEEVVSEILVTAVTPAQVVTMAVTVTMEAEQLAVTAVTPVRMEAREVLVPTVILTLVARVDRVIQVPQEMQVPLEPQTTLM
jgi:hypothetical protein